MTSLELIVQQLGKEPQVVPLAKAMVVGRSRRVDLTVDDDELGREQFRIGFDGDEPFLEALGTTNQTLVDGTVLPAGSKRPLFAGTQIRVGRTTFTLRTAQRTEPSRPGGDFQDATLVAPRPSGPRTPPPPPPAPPDSSDTSEPMRTMQGVRPGSRQPDPTPMPAKTPPPAPSAEPEQTIQMRGGYRPGQAMPPTPAPPPPPNDTSAPERTIAAPRPGPGRPTPPPPPAAPPAPPRTQAMPAKKPPGPETTAPGVSPAAKAQPPQSAPPVRPTTIAVMPVDVAAEIGKADAAEGARAVDVEARLHESTPRLFVKCEGMKRRVRLMKARNMLGRAEAVDVCLPNESVSEQHAEILFDGSTWTLRDRGSTNGSFVDNTHLRGGSQELVRHSLIGLGNVRAIFLFNDRRDRGGQRRLEERAMRLLVQAGRLQADAAREAIRVARADEGQSIAELLLMDTPLSPAEWATAVHTARTQRSFLDVIRPMLERFRRNRRAAPKKP
ncbi:MAG: FHA domain-containing protein [Planctomycetes bacterium]|nr:FHA domain-containing protein [Planctomycetota bacterium]